MNNKSTRRLGRFNKWSVGKIALLYRSGLNPSEVAAWMFRRYGKEWNIDSISGMAGYLSHGRGTKPNTQKLFGDKTPSDLRQAFSNWLEEMRALSKKRSAQMVSRHKDPHFAAANADRMRKMHDDIAFAARRDANLLKAHAPEAAARRIASYKKKLADPVTAKPILDRLAANREKIRSDSQIKKRRSKSISESMREKLKDPKARARLAEQGRKQLEKLRSDPEHTRKHSEQQRERLKKSWKNSRYRHQMSELSREVNNRPEVKMAASQRLKALWGDPAWKAVMMDRQRIARSQQSYKENRSAIQKKKWQNPSYRDRTTKAIRAGVRKQSNRDFMRARLLNLWASPEWAKTQHELISIGVQKYWEVIRGDMRSKYASEERISTVSFAEDERGRAISTPIAATARTPEKEAILKERNSEIMSALKGLSPEGREAVILVHFTSNTINSAARKMGLTSQELTDLLHKTYAKLSHVLSR